MLNLIMRCVRKRQFHREDLLDFSNEDAVHNSKTMVKPKLKLAFIENDSARKETFRKRRKGLLKKIRELTILCDVEACGVIYSPFAQEPEVWPSPVQVHRLAAKLDKVPVTDSISKKFTQKTYLKDRLAKMEDQLEKKRKEVVESEKSNALYRHVGGIISNDLARLDELNELGARELNDLMSLVEKNLREIENHKRRSNIVAQPPANNNVGVAGEPYSADQQTNIDVDLDFWSDHPCSLADLFPPSITIQMG